MRITRRVAAEAESFRQAAGACRAHPLRSALGAIAVAAAVGTLTLVETAIGGLAGYARASAARVFGSETFVVARIASPGQLPRRELERKLERNRPITRSDLRAIERWADDRVIYAGTAQRRAKVTAGALTFEGATISGTGAAMPRIRELGIEEGRFFVEEEADRGAAVVVLGRDLVDELFPGRDPVGRTVRIGGRGFRVIGVQARLGTTAGLSLDRYVWMPLVAYERAFGAADTLQVSARAPAGQPVELAEDRAHASMRALRQQAPGEEDSFDLLLPEASRNFVLALAERVGAVTPLLSLMALLAAVVVVTNTTLVSVAQRTREIGIRRAVGATRAHVIREVLYESALVSLAGGAAGIGVVVALAAAATRVSGFDLAVRPATAAVAFAAAAGAGLAAGLYPARRASSIDVIAAVRSE